MRRLAPHYATRYRAHLTAWQEGRRAVKVGSSPSLCARPGHITRMEGCHTVLRTERKSLLFRRWCRWLKIVTDWSGVMTLQRKRSDCAALEGTSIGLWRTIAFQCVLPRDGLRRAFAAVVQNTSHGSKPTLGSGILGFGLSFPSGR